MPNDLLAVPVQHDHHVDPAEALDHDLGHVDAPPLVWPGRPGFVAGRLAPGLEQLTAPHRQPVLFHKPVHPVLADDQLIYKAQMRPYPPVAPEWVVSLEATDAFQQFGASGGNFGV